MKLAHSHPDRLLRWLLGLALAVLAGATMAAPSHRLTVRLDPAQGRLEATDEVTLRDRPAAALELELAPALRVASVESGNRPVAFTRDGERLSIRLPAGAAGLTIRYGGAPADPSAAQIAPAATWLPGDYAWYPRAGDDDALEVTVLSPPGQVPVLTGKLLREQRGAMLETTFAAYPGAPATLFAGPYVVTERMHGRLRLRTYFPADAQPLAPEYLEAAARYIDEFSAILGSYPYDGFAIVASEDAVGYGFAGLTYVSRRILHLPFMRGRSLAHEILHDWWGNSVRTAADGNWAEALTTYMADYRTSPAPQRDQMRRDWLRDYAALPPAEDMALESFRGRVHSHDQIVGYGKGAFVFAMLEANIGTRAFDDGVARFFRAHEGRSAGWRDLRQAFEAASGQRLEGFFEQWLKRVGAPRLRLAQARFSTSAVRLAIEQSAPAYALRVPVAIRTSEGSETHIVGTAAEHASVEVATRGRPLAVQVDPGQELFRRLAAAEITPILRDLTIQPQVQTVVDEMPAAAATQARELAQALLRDAGAPVTVARWDRRRPAVVFGLGTPAQLAARIGVPAPELPAQPSTASVWAARQDGVPVMLVCAQDAAALAALVRPLPHYGRQGWLLFRGSQAVAQGNWPPQPAPELSAQAP